jgi:enamine deaminase RidA (YjgF/YER057c/UK114 family)
MSTQGKAKLEAVHPSPDQASIMPYAPGVIAPAGSRIMYVAGATSSPLYHQHPHVDEEHQHPHDIREQTRRVMDSLKLVLDHVGATFGDVLKFNRYLTDIRDMDGVNEAMKPYMNGWRPASTTLCINQLSSPGARIEIDMVVALPPEK